MSSILSSINTLSEDEQNILYKAPAVVTIMIAGADKDIDKKEEMRARKLVNYRTFTSDIFLHDYYETVNDLFEGHMNELMAAWSPETGAEAMSNALSEVGTVMAKLPEDHAAHLKDSLKSLAKKVAEADGGFLHMGGISAEERQLLDLKELG